MSDTEIEIRRAVADMDTEQLEELFGDEGMVGEEARDTLVAYGYKFTRIKEVHMSGWAMAYPDDDPRNKKATLCSKCGKGEADGIGVIIEGDCADCRRAWA